MIINDFFKNEYLVVGNTYDNFIFENCPKEFLSCAKIMLSKENNGVKPCVVYLNREQEVLFEKIINNCEKDFQKELLSRDFITALVMREVVKYKNEVEDIKKFLNLQISAFMQNNFEQVKECHLHSFMPFDVKRLSKDIGKIELVFILEDTQNKNIQQAVNVFISSREPYSVKVFTNNERLPSYYDLNGNIIECPHDFMRRDVNDFIHINNEEQEQ